MSLFVCDKCGCVERTALSRYWGRERWNEALCSECDPKLGKWHGHFDKGKWDGKSKVLNRSEQR